MIKGLKGYPFNEQGFRQESRCQKLFIVAEDKKVM